jgi:hypothetical protein
MPSSESLRATREPRRPVEARYSEGGLCSDHDGFTPLTINRERAKPAQSTGFHRPLNGHSAGTHWSRSDDSLAVRRAYH